MTETLHVVGREWADGVTVRRGPKWLAHAGETVTLCECSSDGDSHVVVGKALLTAVWYGKLRDIPARVLGEHYSESCRTYTGILTALRKVYGGGVCGETYVTAMHVSLGRPRRSPS